MPSSEPYLDVAVEFLNLLLQNSNEFWTNYDGAKGAIEEYFDKALTAEELQDGYDLRQSFDFITVRAFSSLFFTASSSCLNPNTMFHMEVAFPLCWVDFVSP